MIFRIIGGICIIITCLLIGEFFVEKEKERIYLLKELKKMGELWKGSIRQGTFNIIEAMKLIKEKLDERLKICLENIISLLNENNDNKIENIWNKNVEEALNNTPLNISDIEIVKKLADIMGCFDKELQLVNLDNYIVEINELIDKSKKDLADKKRLYKTFSIMAGIFIIIVFIS